MNETALQIPDLNKLSNSQLRLIERLHDKQLAASMFSDTANFGREIIKPLIQHPAFGLVLAWLLIEQLNIHNAFGRTAAESNASSSQLATILLTAQIIDSVVPG